MPSRRRKSLKRRELFVVKLGAPAAIPRIGGFVVAQLLAGVLQLAAVALAETLGLPLPPEQIIADYFACRDVYLAEHDGGLLPGAAAFIAFMTAGEGREILTEAGYLPPAA